MDSPIKIIHTSETAMGGVGIYQKNLSMMPRDRFQQTFLIPEHHSGIMEGDERVITYPMKRRGVRGILQQILSLRRVIKSGRPDIVFFHSTLSLPTLAIAKLFSRDIKMIYCAHGWASAQYDAGLKSKAVKFIEGSLCGFADLIVNVSRNDQKKANLEKYKGHHILIENAVPDVAKSDLEYALPRDDEKIDLLFVGRFDHQKGIDILLTAFENASRARSDLRLHVIGAAVRGNRELKFPENVNVIGWVPREDIDIWYRSVDALVVSSRWEGLPLVIPESMRNGTPVIVSRRSGMEDLISERCTGLSFDLDVSSLTQVLIGINRRDLRNMRPACRNLFERRYSMERLLEEVARAYKYVTDEKQSLGERQAIE